MLVTGTLAEKIASAVDRNGMDRIIASDEKKINILQICIHGSNVTKIQTT